MQKKQVGTFVSGFVFLGFFQEFQNFFYMTLDAHLVPYMNNISAGIDQKCASHNTLLNPAVYLLLAPNAIAFHNLFLAIA